MEAVRWTAWQNYRCEPARRAAQHGPAPESETTLTPETTRARVFQYTPLGHEQSPFDKNATYLGLTPEERKRRGVPDESCQSINYNPKVLPNYRRLELDNRGWNGKWENKKVRNANADWALAHAIMCQLDMTDYQQRRFHNLFWKLDRQKLGLATEKVIFGLCMLVCWEDGRKASPRQKPWDEEFAQFASDRRYRKPLSLFEKVKTRLRERVKNPDRRRTPPADPIAPISPNWPKTGPDSDGVTS